MVRAGRDELRAILSVYFDQGGRELQVNVVDSETLRSALVLFQALALGLRVVAGFAGIRLYPDEPEFLRIQLPKFLRWTKH